jgi:iron complex outermembrane receptor protein
MIYRALLMLLMIIVCPRLLHALPANNRLSGIIKDNDNKPLPGAIIEIPDLKRGAITDSLGSYYIADLPKGTYVVVVNMISFSPVTRTINITSGDTRQNFKLDESAIESHEVVVTGQSKATEIRKSPEPIITINSQYLKETESTNIIDAIANIPGIKAVTTGPNVSKPIIRGLGYNRVLTLYDGMRQEGQQWGDEHGIEVDQFNVDRIEVVKGPSSLIYGSDALAGVVNLIPTPPAPEGTIKGNITGDYQGNNGLLGGSALLEGTKNGLYWIGRVSHKEAKDYQDPTDGRVYNTRYQETDISATAGIRKKWGSSQLQFTAFDDLQGIPDGSRDSATRKFTKQVTEADTLPRPIVSSSEMNRYAIPTLHQHVQHYRAMLTNNIITGDSRVAVNLGFERSVRREYSHPEDAAQPGLYLQLNSFLYDIKYYAAAVNGWNITTGVNGMYQVNDVTQGTDFVIPSYNQFDIGPFAMVKKNFGKLDVSAGLRYDSRTFHNDALATRPDPVTGFDMPYSGNGNANTVFNKYSHTFSGVTYSGGLTYAFSNKISLKTNVSRGFRAPNILEISANGVHPGTGIYQIGGLDLKPEFSLQEDIGLDYVTRHVSGTVAFFNNNISNYIYNRRLDTIIVPNNQTYQFTATQAQLYGGEIQIDIHPHPLDWLHFENSFSVVYGLNNGTGSIKTGDTDRYLPFIPPPHGISELRANFKKPAKWLANTFVKLQLEYYTAQNRVFSAYGTETPTPGYTLLNAGIGTDITNRKGVVTCNISVFGNNLGNVAYQDHLSRLKYFEPYPNDPRGHSGIYNMGRNLGIKVEIPLYVKHA